MNQKKLPLAKLHKKVHLLICAHHSIEQHATNPLSLHPLKLFHRIIKKLTH